MARKPGPQDRIAAAFARNDWLGRCPAELRRRLIQHAQISTVEAGRWLYDKGDAAHGLYGVLSGSVTTYVRLDDGENVPVNISAPGSIFGYAAQVLGGHRVTTAIAREKSEIVFVPQHALVRIAQDLPSLWLHFAELATAQLTWAIRDIAERVRLGPRARLAARLNAHAAAWGVATGATVLPIRQDELAALMGLSRKTINGFLREFEQMGLVALGYRTIEILDERGLKRIAMEDRT